MEVWRNSPKIVVKVPINYYHDETEVCMTRPQCSITSRHLTLSIHFMSKIVNRSHHINTMLWNYIYWLDRESLSSRASSQHSSACSRLTLKVNKLHKCVHCKSKTLFFKVFFIADTKSVYFYEFIFSVSWKQSHNNGCWQSVTLTAVMWCSGKRLTVYFSAFSGWTRNLVKKAQREVRQSQSMWPTLSTVNCFCHRHLMNCEPRELFQSIFYIWLNSLSNSGVEIFNKSKDGQTFKDCISQQVNFL